MTSEPLSAYLRRTQGSPELSWDEIAERVEQLEQAAAGNASQPELPCYQAPVHGWRVPIPGLWGWCQINAAVVRRVRELLFGKENG